MILGRFAILVVLGVAFIGCVEGKSYVSANKNQKVEKNVLKKPPSKIDHLTEANFDGKIMLLGYDLAKDLIQPDEYVEVTWYWKVKAAPGPGWRLFTHVLTPMANPRSTETRSASSARTFSQSTGSPA